MIMTLPLRGDDHDRSSDDQNFDASKDCSLAQEEEGNGDDAANEAESAFLREEANVEEGACGASENLPSAAKQTSTCDEPLGDSLGWPLPEREDSVNCKGLEQGEEDEIEGDQYDFPEHVEELMVDLSDSDASQRNCARPVKRRLLSNVDTRGLSEDEA